MLCCAEHRTLGVACTSRASAIHTLARCLKRQQGSRLRLPSTLCATSFQVLSPGLVQSEPQPSSPRPVPAQPALSLPRSWAEEDNALPIFTSLDGDILTAANQFAYYEALRSGLKALRALGVAGISVDVLWGCVEGAGPGVYDWTAYRRLLGLIRDEGFVAQVVLCFHATDAVPLPAWVVEAGRANPDLHYTDRAGVRCADCITLGADEVPALAGRTPLAAYRDLMASFAAEMAPFLGSTVTDVVIGLGPDGELKYPAHPRDRRWTFPGIGEFQCYDRYMLAGLAACAHQVGQPSWGGGGPHDAGAYCNWPHQTGFFGQRGSWAAPYGRFFLQWYADMLAQHADRVLGAAREVLGGGGAQTDPWVGDGAGGGFGLPSDGGGLVLPPGAGRWGHSAHSGGAGRAGGEAGGGARAPVRLHARLPGLHWWYNTASHAPELTAGYYNTSQRDGYLPVMQVLARHGVGARLRGAELRTGELMPQACCDPERQLTAQRTAAAALRLPVGLESLAARFDEGALRRLEAAAFDTQLSAGIELPQVQSLVFNRMCDAMFEPGNWARFKAFTRSVRNRADAMGSGGAGVGGGGVEAGGRGRQGGWRAQAEVAAAVQAK